MIFRPLIVLLTLIPFVLSFIRDYRRWIFFGFPRILPPEIFQRRIERLTNKIARLGPTFIKLVQVLAMREDILPRAYTNEFKKLQDQVPPFPFKKVKKIIEKETGKRLGEIFERFEREPIAAASLGQVHRARYMGEEVAVKVLRPDVKNKVSADLKIIGIILFIISSFFESHTLNIFRTIYNEFSRMIKMEMDFSLEAKNAEQFRINFKDEPFIIIPEIYKEISKNRIVVLKYYEGIRVDDTPGLKKLNIDPIHLIENLVRIYTHQVVIDGFLHADPHPGNLLVRDDGRIVMVDFGMVVEFDEQTKIELLKMAIAAVRRDIDGVVNGFYKLRMVGPDVNRTTLRDAAEVLMNINWSTEYSPHQIQQIGEDILKTFYRFPLRLPSNLVYLFRTSALIEGIGISFDPKFNGLRFATPIIKELVKKVYVIPERSWKDRLIDQVSKASEFLMNLEKVIYRAEREQLKVKAHEIDIEEVEKFLESFLRRILISIFAIGIGLFIYIVFLVTKNTLYLIIGFIFALSIIAILIILPIRKRIDRG